MNWSKTRIAGAMLLAVSSLFVTGCGGGDDISAALQAIVTAQQQAQLASTNKSIIESSLGEYNYRPTGGKVAGTSAVKSSFENTSSAMGGKELIQQTDYRNSVDTEGRLTKQKAVFGTMSASTAYTYDGSNTAVAGIRTNDPLNNVTQYAYTYDTSGRISEFTITKTHFSGTATVSTTSIVYDVNGRTHSTTSGGSITGIFVFDSHNNPVSISIGTDVFYRYARTYDAYGNETETKAYSKDSATGPDVLQVDTVQTYGPHGALTSKSIFYNPKMAHTEEGTNTYSSNGKLATEAVVLKDTNGNITSSSISTYTYDTNGNQLSFNHLGRNAAGTIVGGVYSLQNTYVTLVSGKDDQ